MGRASKEKSGSFIVKLVPALIIIALLMAAYARNALWEDVVRKGPNKARAYHNRGLAHAEKGQYDSAINDYNRSIAVIRDHSEA